MFSLLMLVVPLVVLQVIVGARPLFDVGRRDAGVLAVAVALQVSAVHPAVPGRVVVPASFAAGVVAAIGVVRRSTSSPWARALIVGGAVLNLVPIGMRGAMPVSPAAMVSLAATGSDEPVWMASKHQLDSSAGVVGVLSDSIVVGSVAIVSVGDVALALGLVLLAWSRRSPAGAETLVEGN
ncbi:MAG: DUF5317 family protein [Acidimicrobiales bacterium]